MSRFGGVPLSDHTQHTGPSTFAFRKRWAQIDWRSLSSVDVDRIAQEMDFHALQQCIFNVTFCNIQSEEFRNVDLNFIKLFRLSQLIIEYLLYTQQYLTDQMSSIENQGKQAVGELEKMREAIHNKDLELGAIRKENRKRRKAIRAYQGMVNIPATDLHACIVCRRTFLCEHCVLNHMQRRHPHHPSLRQPTPPKVVDPEEIQAKVLEQVRERMREERAQLCNELAEEAREAEREQRQKIEEWKERERERMKFEAHQSKELLMNELKQEQTEREKVEEELQQAREQVTILKAKQKSHLGVLEGADEIDLHASSKAVEETQQEVEQLKDQFHTKLSQVEAELKRQDKTWKKKIKKMTESYEQKLQESQLRVLTLEQSLHESLASGQQTEGDNTAMLKQLKSIQKRVKDHDEQLMMQKMNLTTLQERSLALGSSSPASATCKAEEEDDTETESDSDSDESKEEHKFTPYPHRPSISTLYNHSSDQMSVAHRTAETLLNDALKQRGIDSTSNGLSQQQLANGLKLLELQRHSQIQAHYNFTEHRNRLEREVEQISAAEVKFVPPTDLEEFVKKRKKGKKKKEKLSAETGHKSHETTQTASKKPPMPSAASAPASSAVRQPSLTTPPMSPVQPPTMSATIPQPRKMKPASHKSPGIVVTPSTSSPSITKKPKVVMVGREMGGVDNESMEDFDSSTLGSISETDPESERDPSPQAGSQVAASKGKSQVVEVTPVLPFKADSEEEEESLEEISMAPVSSTPVKADAKAKAQPVTVAGGRSKSGAIPMTASTVVVQPASPAQAKGSSVPVMLAPFPHPALDDESDTFSLSESSNAPPPVNPFSQRQITDSSIPTLHSQKASASGTKTLTRTVSSRSALTVISDTFDDSKSDFSDDLEITHLT